MTAANGWNSVELRDNRYNHIVHMVSAANGAEEFYSTEVRSPFSCVSLLLPLFCFYFGHLITNLIQSSSSIKYVKYMD